MKKQWNILKRKFAYQGYFKAESLEIQHSLHAGGMGETIQRELFQRGPVGGVLPYDPVLDQVLLIEQFRVGALEDVNGPWLTEIIAGVIEHGESATDMLHREAQEEAGIQLDELTHISDYWASPGASNEHVSLHFALADLSQAGGVHGVAEEGEDILVKVVSADQAIQLLQQGKIANAMSIIALQWFALQDRAALRKQSI